MAQRDVRNRVLQSFREELRHEHRFTWFPPGQDRQAMIARQVQAALKTSGTVFALRPLDEQRIATVLRKRHTCEQDCAAEIVRALCLLLKPILEVMTEITNLVFDVYARATKNISATYNAELNSFSEECVDRFFLELIISDLEEARCEIWKVLHETSRKKSNAEDRAADIARWFEKKFGSGEE